MNKIVEIGSEFDLSYESLTNSTSDNLFNLLEKNNFNYLLFNSGRASITYLINEILPKNKKVLLPAYLCESILEQFKFKNIEYDFFKITDDFQIDLIDLKSKIDENVKCIYLINYFGFNQKEETLSFLNGLKQNGVLIIEDTTHSLFSSFENIGDYMVASIRKWFFIPDGGVVYSRFEMLEPKVEYCNKISSLRMEAAILKNLYLRGIDIKKDEFMKLNMEAEELLDRQNTVFGISDISKLIIRNTSLSTIIAKRKLNYRILDQYISKNSFIKNVFIYKDERICPLGYIVYAENRAALRALLVKNNIYPPIHWLPPSEISDNADFTCETNISKHILTIPVDQRYDENHMAKIINVLKEYRG